MDIFYVYLWIAGKAMMSKRYKYELVTHKKFKKKKLYNQSVDINRIHEPKQGA